MQQIGRTMSVDGVTVSGQHHDKRYATRQLMRLATHFLKFFLTGGAI